MAHILVIDDEPFMHHLLRMLLEPNGHRVSAMSDGPSGIALARADKPALIICDLIMPELTGVDFLTTLKADPALAGVPVIVLTASPTGKLIDEARAAGAFKCVHKPFARAELLRQVNEALSGQS
jgi:CheY-like chemotaxis protein